jgi:exosortase D (VPLPA-CTERM-specific)
MQYQSIVQRSTNVTQLFFATAVCIYIYVYYKTILYTSTIWDTEEYSHCYLIPFIVAALVVKRLQEDTQYVRSSWAGVWIVCVAIALLVVGELSALYDFAQYAAVLTIIGLFIVTLGTRTTWNIAGPLGLLFFIVPLPKFVYVELSAWLQLVSSTLGVEILDLFDVPVFQDGSIIDLGGLRLEVAEACNGLRYLFPLLSLGYLAAYFLKDAWWKKIVLVLSAAPICIAMNSLRIAVIGVTVDLWGNEMAGGIVHTVEGWVVFMVSAAILMAEAYALQYIGRRGRFNLSFFPSSRAPLTGPVLVSAPMLAVLGLLGLAAVANAVGLVSDRQEIRPARQDFMDFPLTLPGGWSGRRLSLRQDELAALQLNDYVLTDFTSPSGGVVNFYVAYYASQRKGESPHSPRVCIPGGGWGISDISPYAVSGVGAGRAPLIVNRAIIKKGDQTQLVYYWFQERGRTIANEYAAKWYLLEDSLIKDRTDGALVRVVTPISPGTDIKVGDARLQHFLEAGLPPLREFVPD